MVAPFISSLRGRRGDAQLYAAISAQMSSLYDFFRRLYAQEQAEVR